MSSYYKYQNQCPKIDIGFRLSLFSLDIERALELFVEFHNKDNDDKCLDYGSDFQTRHKKH